MSSLDEIIDNLGNYWNESVFVDNLSPEEAKAQIKAWVAEEIIGEDEILPKARIGYDHARNELRAELRAKLEES